MTRIPARRLANQLTARFLVTHSADDLLAACGAPPKTCPELTHLKVTQKPW